MTYSNPSGNEADVDSHFMAIALAEARKGRFWASPNPHVGCVLVRAGNELARGFTQPPGESHAEIDALNKVSDARGATAYVTLEPCAHSGRTGPCVDALITAGISRVVAAIEDPYPEVAGRGLARLRDSGIEVVTGVLADEARSEIAGFLLRLTRGWGKVRLKLAASLDGRTAMASGESQWVTGPAARADVQCLRAESCVVVTGIGTVLADDCSLTVRREQLPLTGDELERACTRQPLRVVLDKQLRIPTSARVLNACGSSMVFYGDTDVASVDRAKWPEQVELQATDVTEGRLKLKSVLKALGSRGANNILVEAGPTLASSLLEAGLVDEVVIYQAPKLLGASARPLVYSSYNRLSDALELRLLEVSRVGHDLRMIAEPIKQESACSQEL